MILGRCPKPRRSGLAILRAFPRGLHYRLMPIVNWGAAPNISRSGLAILRAFPRGLHYRLMPIVRNI